ncbi:hypothetical protein GCM10025876_40210 [Demequina litorisediminis]|uniref:Uncharacterized protein n=2 Tax=Demequina litorisediminis TaxID=1849022 RepID=A0ABQ6IKY2_9MICO|nr:SCO6880 family protein [Demequina litorisediminis]GMA37817.1 hypothetical protein GCM10025876_40210 [Demequina litorisediminis]
MDSLGRPFALIYSPPGGLHTLVIETEPDGAALVDDEQIDQWVGSWGWWLSHLAGEPGLVGASVTVETAPDTGGRLGREVAANISGDAPQFARQVLADTVENYPAGSSVVRAYLALTFVSSTKKADRVGRELASRLPELTGTLASTGAGVAAPLDAARLCEVIRTAYDPAVASLIDEARMAGDHVPLEFSDVGPTAAEASWDSYRHDDATSRTWVMTGAPHGLISARGLEKLLAPQRGIARKRVTLMFEPIDPGRAAGMVEQDIRTANQRATQRQQVAARDSLEMLQAATTAAEEAAGAALMNFAMLVTATTVGTGGAADADVAAAIDSASKAARIRLRPAYGAQDAAFAIGLPLGIIPARRAELTASIRSAL